MTLEVKGAESTRFVDVPLDVVMRYHYRLQNRAARFGGQASLRWIMQRDEAEREMWVDRFRNSSDTLGEVIAAIFVTREAMWEVPPEAQSRPARLTDSYDPQSSKPKGGRSDRPKGDGKGDRGKGNGKVTLLPSKKVAMQLNDGSKLCSKYQKNKCTQQNCQFLHKCGVVLQSGRVCGEKHPASAHKAR